jgi:hypothetical protein
MDCETRFKFNDRPKESQISAVAIQLVVPANG